MTLDSKSESSELIISIEKSDLFERVSPSRAPHSIKCPSRCVKIENVQVQFFLEGHKNLRNYPYGFDVY